jgi:hypothetical protein
MRTMTSRIEERISEMITIKRNDEFMGDVLDSVRNMHEQLYGGYVVLRTKN